MIIEIKTIFLNKISQQFEKELKIKNWKKKNLLSGSKVKGFKFISFRVKPKEIKTTLIKLL